MSCKATPSAFPERGGNQGILFTGVMTRCFLRPDSRRASIFEETRMEMIGLNSLKTAVTDKIVTPQKNTAAIAIAALAVATIALIIATRKGK